MNQPKSEPAIPFSTNAGAGLWDILLTAPFSRRGLLRGRRFRENKRKLSWPEQYQKSSYC